MSSSTIPVVPATEENAGQPLRPVKLTTPRPTKPDYFPLSLVRRPTGPSVYPGAAAAEDASKGLLVSDAMHDMSFYTEVSESLPDAGRPVLNSVLFSQRHVVNDSPSVEEEISSINERIRLWRASRLQEVITSYEHKNEQAALDKKVEERIQQRQEAERDRALRRIKRMLDTLAPELEKEISTSSMTASEVLNGTRREALQRQWKERDEIQERILRDIRLTDRRWLVDRQFQRNMEERNSLDSQHYYSFLSLRMDERKEFCRLYEAFYDNKIVVGVIDDETAVRERVMRLETEDRLDIMVQMRKVIPIPCPSQDTADEAKMLPPQGFITAEYTQVPLPAPQKEDERQLTDDARESDALENEAELGEKEMTDVPVELDELDAPEEVEEKQVADDPQELDVEQPEEEEKELDVLKETEAREAEEVADVPQELDVLQKEAAQHGNETANAPVELDELDAPEEVEEKQVKAGQFENGEMVDEV